MKEFERVYAKLVYFWEGELYLSIQSFYIRNFYEYVLLLTTIKQI